MSLLQLSALVVVFCEVSHGQCMGRVRAVVPITNPRCVSTPAQNNAVDDLSSLLLLANAVDNAKCAKCGYGKGGCNCNGGCCGTFVNPEEIIMKLINALIIATTNNSGGGYRYYGGHNGNNLIDLGLLQKNSNNGLDALNLGLGGKGVLGLNLGGGSSTTGGPKGGSPGVVHKGNPSDLIDLGLLQKDAASGGLSVVNAALGDTGILNTVLGGVK